jgi:tripartite-type tricarboxylate transporter receptor subunit TctC
MTVLLRRLVLTLALLPVALAARAQDYPNHEIKAICGFPAGSGADVIVRYIAEKLRLVVGQPVIVENKAGALSAIAAEAVAKSKPDGYTIFITGGGPLTANLFAFKKLNYDPIKDFTPVAPLLVQPFILVVDAKSPVRSVADLTALLRQKGDKAFYAAPSMLPIANAEMYKAATGIKATQVMYRTANDAMNDLIAGQVDLFFADPVFAIEQANAGRLRALAVTTPKRVAPLPDLPSMAELGLPSVEVTSWWSVYMPANAPAEIVEKLNGWTRQIVATEETRKFFASFGAEPWSGSAQELAQHHAQEIKLWTKVASIAKLEAQ